MTLYVAASISIRSENGISFGMLRRIDDDRIVFETDGELVPGDDMELRIQLTGLQATIYSHARVTSAVSRQDALSRYCAQLHDMSRDDEALFQEWQAEISQGGSLHRSDLLASAIGCGDSSGPRDPRRIEDNLKRFDERHNELSNPALSNPWGITTETSNTRAGMGRQAIRAALRASLARQGGNKQPAHQSAGTSRSASTSTAPAAVQPPSPPGGAPEPAPHRPASRPPSGSRPPDPGITNSTVSQAGRYRSRQAISDPSPFPTMSSPAARSNTSTTSSNARWRRKVVVRRTDTVTPDSANASHTSRPSRKRPPRKKPIPKSTRPTPPTATPSKRSRVERPEPASQPGRPLPPTRPAPPSRSTTRGPAISFDQTSEPARLIVHFEHRSVYQAQYQQYLCNNALFLQIPEPHPTEGTRLAVTIGLPSGMRVQAPGKIEVLIPTGTGISLELDEESRQVLSMAFYM